MIINFNKTKFNRRYIELIFEAYNFAGGFRYYDVVINDRCLIESALDCGMDA